MNLGQMFLVGFRGARVSETDWLMKNIAQDNLGGVILFDRNISGERQNFTSPEMLTCLTRELLELSEKTLFVAVDQEGGMVCRLKEKDGFPQIDSAASLSRKNTCEVEQQAGIQAETLKQYGINLNFAPVVDLNLYPENPVIGGYERSFGAQPDKVAALATVVIDCHHLYNIACCLKHFPGHGSSREDSHFGFVDITEHWNKAELDPYKLLIRSGYEDGVMTGHLVHRGLDASGQPATLSHPIITGILRKRLHFNGVVFSDDLQMAAISRGWSYKEAVQQAVLAGVDVLVVGNNLGNQENAVEQGIEAILALLDQGKVSVDHIQSSLNRIHTLKQKIAGELPWKSSIQPTAW